MRSPRAVGRWSRSSGFTLLELMIAVAVVVILSTIAVNSYLNSVEKTDRNDAKQALSQAAQILERCYTQNYYYYNSTPSLDCSAPPASTTATPQTLSTNKWYVITAPTRTATAYTLTATPVSGPPKKDKLCTSFSLDNQGNQTSTGTASPTLCWSGHW